MKASRLLLCAFVVICCASLAPAQSLVTVYSHDFQTPVGTEWSDWDRETVPAGTRTFLGRFGGEPVTLDLWDLADHCTVEVTFELFIIDSWEGSVGYYAGPDIWDLNAATPGDCCPVENLLHATFANCDCRYQTYPDTYPHVHHPGLTGADEVDTLGYEDDSVYYLTFTFFHDQPELRLTFAGSSALQGWTDEAWGIDNIVVRMDTNGTNCCRATRTLPDGYSSFADLQVQIEVNPNPRSEVHVVEEIIPGGWWVMAMSDGGVYNDETRTIKWGPFFDDVGRTLTYDVRAPGDATPTYLFRGDMFVDGENEDICGDSTIEPGGYHPADTDTDWMIGASELTAYGAAWANTEDWPTGPVPIPADYVTIAGLIWRDSGSYHYDAAFMPPWVSGSGKLAAGGSAVGAFGSTGYRAGKALDVRVSVVPDAETMAYLVSDTPPAGWSVAEISDNGRWDVASASVKWGPFFDDQPKSLSYTVMPVAGENEEATFMGEASFNGSTVIVEGARSISEGGNIQPDEAIQ